MPEDKKKTPAAKKAPVKKSVVKDKEEKKAKPAKKVEAIEATGTAETPTLAMQNEQENAAKVAKSGSFIPAIGRRKQAIARVRLIKNGKGSVIINNKAYDAYFTTYELRNSVMAPLKAVGQDSSVDVSARVLGGGIRGQAEAVRHGIARALIVLNPTFRKTLKKLGFLSRDPRERERKKPGLKSARRAPQWSKR